MSILLCLGFVLQVMVLYLYFHFSALALKANEHGEDLWIASFVSNHENYPPDADASCGSERRKIINYKNRHHRWRVEKKNDLMEERGL